MRRGKVWQRETIQLLPCGGWLQFLRHSLFTPSGWYLLPRTMWTMRTIDYPISRLTDMSQDAEEVFLWRWWRIPHCGSKHKPRITCRARYQAEDAESVSYRCGFFHVLDSKVSLLFLLGPVSSLQQISGRSSKTWAPNHFSAKPSYRMEDGFNSDIMRFIIAALCILYLLDGKVSSFLCQQSLVFNGLRDDGDKNFILCCTLAAAPRKNASNLQVIQTASDRRNVVHRVDGDVSLFILLDTITNAR